jgi:hypothetical protein
LNPPDDDFNEFIAGESALIFSVSLPEFEMPY